MRYHINFEGKIYPCKAKVLKCPYGEEFHADNKVELYYKLMASHGVDTKPSQRGMKEIESTNRLKSLYSLSIDIAKVDYPLDIIVATLKEGLIHLEKPEVKQELAKWKEFEKDAAGYVKAAKLFNLDIPYYVPKEIEKMGINMYLKERKPNVNLVNRKEDLKVAQKEILGELEKRRKMFEEYNQYKLGLRHDNYESTYAWMARDFEKFSHDLNTSKMITQPIFYGDIEKAKETIKNMDDYELLSTFDDYSITDEEIERNVREANYFEYEWRKDLSDAANKSMERWYNRNKEIYESWKFNTPRRVLISMEVANELDRRGVLRQDSSIGEMLSKRKK